MRKAVFAFALVACVIGFSRADAAVMLFNGAVGLTDPPAGYTEAGYTLIPSAINVAGIASSADVVGGHSSNVFAFGGLGTTVTLTQNAPGTFDLISLLVGFMNLTSPPVGNINALGNVFGGGTVNASFTPSNPLSGGLWNLAGFTNLTSVVFSNAEGNDVIAFDNLTVVPFSPPAAVPEPGSCLFLAGVGLYGIFRRRRVSSLRLSEEQAN